MGNIGLLFAISCPSSHFPAASANSASPTPEPSLQLGLPRSDEFIGLKIQTEGHRRTSSFRSYHFGSVMPLSLPVPATIMLCVFQVLNTGLQTRPRGPLFFAHVSARTTCICTHRQQLTGTVCGTSRFSVLPTFTPLLVWSRFRRSRVLRLDGIGLSRSQRGHARCHYQARVEGSPRRHGTSASSLRPGRRRSCQGFPKHPTGTSARRWVR